MSKLKKDTDLKYKCNCLKNDCILRTYADYTKARENIIMTHILKLDVCNCDICKKQNLLDTCDGNTLVKFRHNIISNIYNKPPCVVALNYIKMSLIVTDFKKSNDDLGTEIKMAIQVKQEDNRELLFIKELLNKCYEENIKLKKENIFQTETIKEHIKEKRLLKNELKKLKTLIIDFKYSNEPSEPLELEEPLDLEEPLEPDNKPEESNNEILKLYDSIIFYLCNQNISIGAVFERLGLVRSNIKEYIKKFINLKIRRINIAHPKPLYIIKNDDDCLNILNSI